MILSHLLPNHDHYQLVGKGGFGHVFKVFHPLDNMYYAIKQIPVSEKNIAVALKEVRILASIHHPNIIRYNHSWVSNVPCGEFSEESGSDEEEDEEEHALLFPENSFYFNIQMEYCPFVLRSYLRDCQSVDFKTCFDIIGQTTEGLAFLHSQSIVHCDLKPDNILMSSLSPLRVKITDFGLAKKLFPSQDATDSYDVGTFLYVAPEQWSHNLFSYASDVYSLGIVAYETQFSFLTDMERHLCLENLKKNREAVCPYFRDLILTMTNPSPDQRPSIFAIKKHFLNLMDPVVICRDLVWEILTTVLEHVST